MSTYLITIEEPTGAILAQEDIENDISPMDALLNYAADRGWKPEQDELDPTFNTERWTMTESDGTRISVELLS